MPTRSQELIRGHMTPKSYRGFWIPYAKPLMVPERGTIKVIA
jgi:hypothetical protein